MQMALKRKLTGGPEAAGSNQQCHELRRPQAAQSFLNFTLAGGAGVSVTGPGASSHGWEVLGFSLAFQTIPYCLFLLWSLRFPTNEEN